MKKPIMSGRDGRALRPGVVLHTALQQQRRCNDDEGGHNHANKATLDAIEVHSGANVGYVPVIVDANTIEWQEQSGTGGTANWQFIPPVGEA